MMLFFSLGASVEYDSDENSDTSNEVKNADDDMINSKNKNSKNKKLKLENKKKVKNISKSKPLSVSRNSADKQKVDSSSSNDSLSDASVDDGNDSDYAVKNLNKKNEGKEIKFLKEKLKKKDASDDILKEEDSMDKDIAKLAKMPSRHKKNHTHTKSENDSDSTECEDNPGIKLHFYKYNILLNKPFVNLFANINVISNLQFSLASR